MSQEGNPLFPVFIKLDQVQTLIVGGGNVGLEKLEAILKNDPYANVKLVATSISSEIEELAETSTFIELAERKVKKRDLKGVDLLILATDDRSLHAKLRGWAKKRNILTNVADTPDLCDFYLGSTVKKGDLKIGISTNGQSPTFAKRFREVLEDILPDQTNELLENLNQIRNSLKGDFGSKVKKLNDITKTLSINEPG